MEVLARASALVTVRARGTGTGGRKKSRLVVARGGKATSGKAKATSSGTRGHHNQKRRGGDRDGERVDSSPHSKPRDVSTTGAYKTPMAMPTSLVKECTEGPLEVATDEHRVLVLDVSYQTIDIVPWQRAVTLQMHLKVDVVAYYEGPWALTADQAYYVPAVVRTRSYSRHAGHKTPLMSLHRRNIFIRDGFQCQYCGAKDNLTVDHVVPASKGGPWTWENLTTACSKCNNKKGDKPLKKSGMKLRTTPKAPTVANMCMYTKHGRFVNPPEEWVPFIPVHQIVRTSEGEKSVSDSIAPCR